MAVVSIRTSVGRDGVNAPADVQKVADLLAALGYMSAVRFAPRQETTRSGKPVKQEPPQMLVDAICQFQKDCAPSKTPDGRVDAGGTTLGRLNQLTHPLELLHMKSKRHEGGGKRMSDGGFLIGYKGVGKRTYSLPNGFSLALQVGAQGKYVNVTGRPPSDLIDSARMPNMLKAIEATGRFASTVQCRLLVMRNGVEISRSAPKPLPTPVQPHNGKLLPLDEENNGPKLTYQGNISTKEFYGRTIVKIDGVEKLYFQYFSGFETEQKYRGFDCTTYAGTALGIPFKYHTSGAKLQEYLGVSPCVLKKTDDKGKETSVTLSGASTSDIAEYFKTHRAGVFLFYKSSHVMLIYNNEVHEFTKSSSVDGYRRTKLSARLAELKSSKLTLCQATKHWTPADDKKAEKSDAVVPSPSSKAEAKSTSFSLQLQRSWPSFPSVSGWW